MVWEIKSRCCRLVKKYVSENITNQLLSGSSVDKYAESSNKTIYARVVVSKKEIGPSCNR